MANKVISIKMEEADIEKLRKYFEFLQMTGFTKKENLTFNGFLKHLLNDNLQDDFLKMSAIYKEMCMGFRFYNANDLNLMNSYDLDGDTFKLYEKAMKASMFDSEKKHCEKATEFFDFMGINYVDIPGGVYSELIPVQEEQKSPNEIESFWEAKAWETRDSYGHMEDEFISDLQCIRESDLTEEEKEQVISSMKNFKELKEAERMLKQRR